MLYTRNQTNNITGANGCHDNEIIPLETFQSGACGSGSVGQGQISNDLDPKDTWSGEDDDAVEVESSFIEPLLSNH